MLSIYSYRHFCFVFFFFFFFQAEDGIFFFFKQKTAYDIGVRLVGSEMCIRDRRTRACILRRTTVNNVPFKMIIEDLNCGREIEFAYHGKKYSITNSELSLIHISEPTRRTPISYAVFCLKKKILKKKKTIYQ